MRQKLTEYCNKVNSSLNNGDIKSVVKVINDMENTLSDSALYWNRTVFIKCGCDSEKCWDVMEKYPNEFICVISDDLDEHPGLTIKFKNIEETY